MCQLAIFRATSEEMVAAAFAEKCPEASSPEKHYAVDLTWRFFPDLFRFAHSAAPDDPLVKAMKLAAAEWPLSSVGIPGIERVAGGPQHLDEVLNHPGLRRVYLDRVIARKATDQLQEPRVLSGVLASVGMHTSLIADWKRTWPQEILSELAVAPLE
jgi:MoxR-vWA-beta-propeller ternary system domain bpX4